jgi:molybdenum cofactor biosynthesis enzyme MoaA
MNRDSAKYSVLPQRLLRLELSENCNFECTYCCWKTNGAYAEQVKILNPFFIHRIVSASIASGCTRAMITGGEPFSLPFNYLTDVINLISKERLSDFWILTNGSEITAEKCIELKSNGLQKIVISLGASNQLDFENYTRQKSIQFNSILENISIAVKSDLRVKVDIAVSNSGFPEGKLVFELMEKLSSIGVKEVAFFELHKTLENSSIFNKEFANVKNIVDFLSSNKDWKIVLNERGQTIAKKGSLSVIIPALPIPYKESCIKRRCNRFCQGTYAAYVIPVTENRAILRACHRRFKSGINQILISNEMTDIELKRIFNEIIWLFAYN